MRLHQKLKMEEISAAARVSDCTNIDLETDQSDEEDYDNSDTQSDVQQGPPVLKKRKVVHKIGAAVYKTRYNQSWQVKWPFILPVKGNPHSFHCTVCNRDVSCSHQGERDVLRHSSSDLHKKNTKAMKGVQKLNFGSSSEAKKLQDGVNVCAVCRLMINFIIIDYTG